MKKQITIFSVMGAGLIIFGVYGLSGGITAKEGWELVLKISLVCNVTSGLWLIFRNEPTK